ncbi:MAG: hypothetical protein AAF899_19455 [Pseudomonadota bacterium]
MRAALFPGISTIAAVSLAVGLAAVAQSTDPGRTQASASSLSPLLLTAAIGSQGAVPYPGAGVPTGRSAGLDTRGPVQACGTCHGTGASVGAAVTPGHQALPSVLPATSATREPATTVGALAVTPFHAPTTRDTVKVPDSCTACHGSRV